ncbi:ferric reductase like transmembrane component [Plectosphaerella plurivora]|uniref:Ferric reductase like transmembrane component n=1 Tax=Plectosphaerella plurivora TaxID=936078 RepID=A0A9P9A6I2_9PEZI|nr:ferric reductase like transmembrane component [Plectosphaerella plurivora]
MIFAARARADHEAMTYYAAALAGAMGLFIIFHFLKSLRRFLPAGLVAAFAAPSRLVKRQTVRPAPGMPSVGHTLVSVGYLALNVIFLFVHSDYSAIPMVAVVAARSGWLAVANICFTVFLSLRNTPLAILADRSYERLRFLHGIAGIMIVINVVIHGACYTDFFAQQNNIARIRETDEIYGIIAGFMLLGMIISATVVRRFSYELFYILHATCFVLALVFTSLHHPDLFEKVLIAVGVAGGMWVLDHAVRFGRLSLHGVNNTATVYPLANNGTRVILKKGPSSAHPGQHAYLWIPRIRLAETHPFTIAANEPLEFVVSAHDGFTRDLHAYALKNPGGVLSASIQGPYGIMPDATQYDRVVLIAGGSGASFVVGVALGLLKAMKPSSEQKISLVWVARNSEYIDWFAGHLSKLVAVLNFSVSVYVTGTSRPSSSQATSSQRDGETPPASADGGHMASGLAESDVEAIRYKERYGEGSLGFPIMYERPQMSAIINHAVDDASSKERVLVMGCGPDKMVKEMRASTAARMSVKGPALDFYCEQFSW